MNKLNYNDFIQKWLYLYKREHPEKTHIEAFSAVANFWIKYNKDNNIEDNDNDNSIDK
jgi:hypothetical protein